MKIKPGEVTQYNLSLTNILDSPSLNNMQQWQYYKVNGVRLQMWPQVQGSARVNTEGPSGSLAASFMNDPIGMLWVRDPDVAYTSNELGAFAVFKNINCHEMSPNRYINMYRKLFPMAGVNDDGTTASINIKSVSTKDLGFSWGRIFFARLTNDTASFPGTQDNYVYKFRVSVYVTLKKYIAFSGSNYA